MAEPPNGRHWEEIMLQEFESEQARETGEEHTTRARQENTERLWVLFQCSAGGITDLYREKLLGGEQVFTPFQVAAKSSAALYKESMSACDTAFELGRRYGAAKRNRELSSYLRHHCRSKVRKEDLVSFLTGRLKPRSSPNRTQLAPQDGAADSPEVELQLFRAALVGVDSQPLSGLILDQLTSRKRSSASPSMDISDSPIRKRLRDL